MTANPEMMDFTISIPKVDLKRFKGLAKAMGWVFEKKEPDPLFQRLTQVLPEHLEMSLREILLRRVVTHASQMFV